MSSRCQCSFSGLSDTVVGVGRHRDPISSDKVWLDFAVRELSRVAAGKARGQEAVWRSQCKPAWWDRECSLPWKNPTANPKDSKDTLKTKFECLVQHLRKEGQLPREMEREIELWEADRKAQVFMLTSFSSLLGQASNLHGLLEETCHKMEESGAPSADDNSILSDLLKCLNSCVCKLETTKRKVQGDCSPTTPPCTANNSNSNNNSNNNKRSRSSADTEGPAPSHSPSKKQKVSPPSSSSSPSLSNSPPLLPLSTAAVPSAVILTSPVPPSFSPRASPSQPQPAASAQDPTRVLMAALQRQILQKQTPHAAVSTPSTSHMPRPHIPAISKAGSRHFTPSSKKTRKCVWGPVTASQPVVGTVCPSSSSASVCLPASLPYHPPPAPTSTSALSPALAPVPVPEMSESEIKDFLDLDLKSVEDFAECQFVTNDCQFMDNLLRGPPTDNSVDLPTTTTTNLPCPNPSPPSLSPLPHPSSSLSPVVENPSKSCDPLLGLCLSPSVVSESSSSLGEVLDDPSLSMVQDPEVFSESGYSSESSGEASQRTSLDSETTDSIRDFDLDSPDLEAFMNSYSN